MKRGFICNHCLGRQFAQLTKGTTNEIRGKSIRDLFAFVADSGEDAKIDPVNLHVYEFRNSKIKVGKKTPICKICNNFFDKTEKLSADACRKISKLDYETFVVGTKISGELLRKEEAVWEEMGTDYCEPIKAEINREVGKLLEKETGKKADFENPDIVILIDTEKYEIEVHPNQIWIYGTYQKLVRGIPQTKWFCRVCHGGGCKHCNKKGKMYPTSVEEIVSKPLIKATNSSGTSFHGAGREDIDARCIAWRPFVIEIKNPVKRKFNLSKIQKEINKGKKVKAKLIKICNKETVRKIKSARLTKTYKIIVRFKKPITRKDIKKVVKIRGVISQRTPERVSHRRADIIRRRKVLSISGKMKSRKEAEFLIRTEAGMYVKELATGDNGRTEPSFAGILNNEASVRALDVMKIDKFKV